jgi:two-component system OmpR family response regulator
MPTDPSDHILIVDDDREIRDLLSRFLMKHGYRVSTAGDGRDMRRIMADSRLDLIVLDVMLPGETGLTLCGQIRASSKVPIIMLTAVAEETDRIIGLELGADDYLAKPFNPRELLARIRAVLRRADAREPITVNEQDKNPVLTFAGWTLDLATRQLVNAQGEPVELSTGEYDLLVAFAERPQRVLSRDRLLDLAKGRAAVAFDRSIDVQVGRLRRKIEVDATAPQLITTVRGGGYMFTPQVTRA